MEKPYDLHERTFQFAKAVRLLIRESPYSIQNNEDGKQVIRSSGSVGANYIESNGNLSAKDFSFRLKICRKEAKESAYWLKLLKTTNEDAFNKSFDELIDEATQLKLIFNSIIKKSE